MPMDIGPNRRVAIEIAFAEAILYSRTMTGDQYERLVIRRDPVVHLSKGMPQVRFVELNEIFGVVLHVRSEGAQVLKNAQGRQDQLDTERAGKASMNAASAARAANKPA